MRLYQLETGSVAKFVTHDAYLELIELGEVVEGEAEIIDRVSPWMLLNSNVLDFNGEEFYVLS